MPFEEGPYTGKIHSDSDNTGAAVEGLGSGAASAAEALYNVPAYVWNQSRGAGPAAQFVPQLPYSHVGDDMFREALQKADPSIHGLVQMENLLGGFGLPLGAAEKGIGSVIENIPRAVEGGPGFVTGAANAISKIPGWLGQTPSTAFGRTVTAAGKGAGYGALFGAGGNIAHQSQEPNFQGIDPSQMWNAAGSGALGGSILSGGLHGAAEMAPRILQRFYNWYKPGGFVQAGEQMQPTSQVQGEAQVQEGEKAGTSIVPAYGPQWDSTPSAGVGADVVPRYDTPQLKGSVEQTPIPDEQRFLPGEQTPAALMSRAQRAAMRAENPEVINGEVVRIRSSNPDDYTFKLGAEHTANPEDIPQGEQAQPSVKASIEDTAQIGAKHQTITEYLDTEDAIQRLDEEGVPQDSEEYVSALAANKAAFKAMVQNGVTTEDFEQTTQAGGSPTGEPGKPQK